MDSIFSTNFSTLDAVIVAVYLVASGLVGAFANRYIHSASDYLVGGRSAGTALNVASYIGTGLGLVTLMYASIDAFSHGFAYVTLAIIAFAVGLLLGSTGLVICRLRELRLLTIPEFFERRFNRRVRVTGGIICALAGILNMGLFPKMGATFITYVTGLAASGDDSVMIVNLVTTVLIVVVIIYTVLGGMVSVIVTDFMQFVVLSLGMAVGIYFCLTTPGLSWDEITTTMTQHRGARMFNPLADESYGWLWVMFNFVVAIAAGICWAPEASRALTTRDQRVTRRTFLYGAPGQFARLAIPALWAAAAFTLVANSGELTAYFYPDGLAGDPQHAEQAMPLLLGKLMPVGLLGVLVAGLLAAFMSTHDSYLLCWGSVIARDVVSPLCRQPLNDRDQIRVTRISVVLMGLFLLVWGVWYELPDSLWLYMAVTGSIYLSGAAVVLIGGIYWSRASSTGAMAALLGGLISVAGLFHESISTQLGWEIRTEVIGLTSFATCTILFVVCSLAFPDRRPSPVASIPIPKRAVLGLVLVVGMLGLVGYLSVDAWSWIYLIGLGAFAVLALLLIPFGTRDLVLFFRHLASDRSAEDDPSDSSDP